MVFQDKNYLSSKIRAEPLVKYRFAQNVFIVLTVDTRFGKTVEKIEKCQNVDIFTGLNLFFVTKIRA